MSSASNYLQKDGVRSGILTAAIVVGLIFITGTTAAMNVDLSGMPDKVQEDSTEQFTIRMELNKNDQYIPITGLDVNVGGKTAGIDISNEQVSGDADFITVDSVSKEGGSAASLGYGYGYDADKGVTFGYGQGFGYGYGYGSGYGYESNGQRVLKVQVTLDTSYFSPGDYTLNVTATAGDNEATYIETKDFTIEAANNNNNGGSGGGGGGGAAPGLGTGNQPETPPGRQVAAQVTGDRAKANIGQVEANQAVKVTIPDQASKNAVEAISFKAAQGADNVDVVVRELQDKPESVNDAGTEVYRYQEINVTGVTDQGIESANITFRVNKSFLDSQARDPEDVVMKRFNGGWNELPTRFREETANAYRFVANSDGFSYYAIALEEQVQDQPDQPQNETGTNKTDGTDQPNQDKGGVLPWVIGLLLILAGVGVYFRNEVTEFVMDLMPN